MRAILVTIGLIALAGQGCATSDAPLTPERAAELQRQGLDTLRDCERGAYVESSLCMSLELIVAEYELCRREPPDAPQDCEQVWAELARVRTELRTEPWRPPPLLAPLGSHPW